MDVRVKMTRIRKKHPPKGDDVSTVSAGTCRAGRGEQGEARPAINAPRSGHHLDLERLRLKTWSEFGFSIAETWRTYSIYISICGHSGCADSDVRSLNTTIVEGPIEHHKSRLVSRETGDGLTGTYTGGSLDWTETVLKSSRERLARAGLREASRRDKSMRS